MFFDALGITWRPTLTLIGRWVIMAGTAGGARYLGQTSQSVCGWDYKASFLQFSKQFLIACFKSSFLIQFCRVACNRNIAYEKSTRRLEMPLQLISEGSNTLTIRSMNHSSSVIYISAYYWNKCLHKLLRNTYSEKAHLKKKLMHLKYLEILFRTCFFFRARSYILHERCAHVTN